MDYCSLNLLIHVYMGTLVYMYMYKIQGIVCDRSHNLLCINVFVSVRHAVPGLQRAAVLGGRASVHVLVAAGQGHHRRQQEARADRGAVHAARSAHHRHGPQPRRHVRPSVFDVVYLAACFKHTVIALLFLVAAVTCIHKKCEHLTYK